MADTLPNIALPRGVWVDLYAATGITPIGTRIRVQNLGVKDVYLTTLATEPTDETAYVIVPRAFLAVNDDGDSGAWAQSPYCDGKVNVRIF